MVVKHKGWESLIAGLEMHDWNSGLDDGICMYSRWHHCTLCTMVPSFSPFHSDLRRVSQGRLLAIYRTLLSMNGGWVCVHACITYVIKLHDLSLSFIGEMPLANIIAEIVSDNAAAVRRCPVCCSEPDDTKCRCCGELESHGTHTHNFEDIKDSDNCNKCGLPRNDLTHTAHKYKPSEEKCEITSCCKPKYSSVHYHKFQEQSKLDEKCECGEPHNHQAHFHQFRSKQGDEKCSKCGLQQNVPVHSDNGSCHSYKEKDSVCKDCKKAREDPIHSQYHAFSPQMIVYSHPISKKLLKKACDDASSKAQGRNMVWLVKDNTSTSPLGCKWKLLCNRCDGSTSDLEKHFEERDERDYYYTQPHNMCEEDVRLFKDVCPQNTPSKHSHSTLS